MTRDIWSSTASSLSLCWCIANTCRCPSYTVTLLHYTPPRAPAHLVEDVPVDLPRHLLAPQPGLLLLLLLLVVVGRGLAGAEHCDQSVQYLQVSTISRQCDVSTVVSTLSGQCVVL